MVPASRQTMRALRCAPVRTAMGARGSFAANGGATDERWLGCGAISAFICFTPAIARVMCNHALCATKGGTYTGNDAKAVSCKTALSTENPLFSTRLQRSSLHLDRHAADVRVHGVAVDQELGRKREAARRQLAINVETESSIAADRKLSCKQH